MITMSATNFCRLGIHSSGDSLIELSESGERKSKESKYMRKMKMERTISKNLIFTCQTKTEQTNERVLQYVI